METEYIEKKFAVDRNIQSQKITSLSQLYAGGLMKMLNKLDSNEQTKIHLREKGFEIYGGFIDEEELLTTSLPVGVIANGSHFESSPNCLYLATFERGKGAEKDLMPKFDLAKILKDYILIM